MINEFVWKELVKELETKHVTLVAVSKTKPAEDIQSLYNLGQRDFGENYVQELVDKQATLPKDIRWHFIGHLQSNKVKSIAPFVHLIHAVDSYKLLQEINKQALKNDRVIDVLLQMHIADETTKFGMNADEIAELISNFEVEKESWGNVRIRGLMGMATFTDDELQIREEFARLHSMFKTIKQRNPQFMEQFDICSMGMSSDYKIAVEEGSTLVRIGSMLFGARN